MTSDAKENEPSETDIQGIYTDILAAHEQLLTEQGVYMARCKSIREDISGFYDAAKDKGVTKKVLKAKVAQHLLIKKAEKTRDDLEADEQNEFDMIVGKLGALAELPLGLAALASKTKKTKAHADA